MYAPVVETGGINSKAFFYFPSLEQAATESLELLCVETMHSSLSSLRITLSDCKKLDQQVCKHSVLRARRSLSVHIQLSVLSWLATLAFLLSSALPRQLRYWRGSPEYLRKFVPNVLTIWSFQSAVMAC